MTIEVPLSLFKKAFRPPLCALRLALRKKSCCQLQNLWVGSCPTWSSLQIDVVRIIVFRACPFSKDECPTHVISAKGFVSEVNSLLVFTFGHQESRTDSLALLSFFPIGYGSLVSVISFYGFSIWLWLRYRLKTFFRALISAGGSRVVIAPDHPKNYWKTMHGMLFQLCVHVLIFVMLAFFYCLIAWQLFQIFRIVTAPFIAIKLPSSLDDGPSCFCLMETRGTLVAWPG
ncbi:hypothetical protein RIF29_45980 [Crotalaria pallida]|uniref:Uncharacterized protein n=1 Tax=Crotalaria pallida TaxID=3830 RepID=A0AAN9DT03_CROPI